MAVNLTKKDDIINVKVGDDINISTKLKGGTDAIRFTDSSITLSDLQTERKGTSLIITLKSETSSSDKTKITVLNYFTDNTGTKTNSTLKNIIFKAENERTVSIIDSGLIEGLNITTATKNKVNGTMFSDTINMSDDSNNLTIKAGKGNDVITGGSGNDKIYAQYGNNTITAGKGNDKIYSGKGNDTFVFNSGDGIDTIYSSDKGDTLTINSEIKSYLKVKNNLEISYGDNDKVVLANYFKQNLKNAMDIGDNIELNISGTSKKLEGTLLNDIITGSYKAQKIYSGNGNDTITANKGNDTIYLGSGAKTVKINSGDGNDTIVFQNKNVTGTTLTLEYSDDSDLIYGKSINGKDLLIKNGDETTTIKNYFTYKTAPTIKIGEKDLDITNLSIIGNDKKANKITDTANDDTIIGGSKNDTITLTNGGKDTVDLGKGNDTVVINKSFDGTASITSTSGNDKIILKDGEYNYDNSMIKDSGDLKITNKITYRYFNKDEDGKETVGRTLKIVDNKKTTTLINSVKAGKINGTSGNDVIFASSKNNTINAGKGDDYIYANKGDNVINLSGNYGNDILYVQDSDSVTVKLDKNNYAVDIQGDYLSIETAKDAKSVNSLKIADFYSNKSGSTSEVTIQRKNGDKQTIVSDKRANADYSDDSSNNFVVLSDKDNSQTYFDNAKSNDIVYGLYASTLSYKGGNDMYYGDKENNIYNVDTTIDKATLFIEDNGGKDSLSINDKMDNLRLFFDVKLTDNGSFDVGAETLVISGIDHLNGLKEQTSSDGYVQIDTYFGENGAIETLSSTDTKINLSDWVNYVGKKVADFLKDKNFTSVSEVYSKGGEDLEGLIDVFKNSTYENAQIADKFAKSEQFEIYASKDGDNLIMANKDETIVTVLDYFKNSDTEPYKYTALNSSNKLEEFTVSESDIKNYMNDTSITTVDKTKTFQGTKDADYINLTAVNEDITIFNNGGDDALFVGEGNDTYNITTIDKAPNVVKVYDNGGDDTYNTTLDSALYIEDYAGNDTLNINDTNVTSLAYIFDVVNPNYTDENPTLYTDLFIVDKNKYFNIAMSLYSSVSTATDVDKALESLNGKFGYAWIDDYYGGTQKVETINLNGKEQSFDYTVEGSYANQIQQQVAAWLTTKDYKTAWSVIESHNTTDMAYLFNLYYEVKSSPSTTADTAQTLPS